MTATVNRARELLNDSVGTAVTCEVCGLRKSPHGRGVAPEMSNSLCGIDCDGYYEEPYPGDLWPGEARIDFGFPAKHVEHLKSIRDLLAEVRRLERERDEAREERDAYRRAIVTADSYANGRWEEWGTRAMDVQDILLEALSKTEKPL